MVPYQVPDRFQAAPSTRFRDSRHGPDDGKQVDTVPACFLTFFKWIAHGFQMVTHIFQIASRRIPNGNQTLPDSYTGKISACKVAASQEASTQVTAPGSR